MRPAPAGYAQASPATNRGRWLPAATIKAQQVGSLDHERLVFCSALTLGHARIRNVTYGQNIVLSFSLK